MTKRLRPTALLVLVRKHARRHGCVLHEVPGRGKGSHRLCRVIDEHEREVGRFALPYHARELSWQVLRDIERALADVFGERWMEEK